jgi:hypothetical protein
MSHFPRRYRIVFGLGLSLLAAGGGRAQSTGSATKVDVERVGPKVGDRLPAFTLRDQHGDAHSLMSLLGPKGAVIVFFRSADW